MVDVERGPGERCATVSTLKAVARRTGASRGWRRLRASVAPSTCTISASLRLSFTPVIPPRDQSERSVRYSATYRVLGRRCWRRRFDCTTCSRLRLCMSMMHAQTHVAYLHANSFSGHARSAFICILRLKAIWGDWLVVPPAAFWSSHRRTPNLDGRFSNACLVNCQVWRSSECDASTMFETSGSDLIAIW